MNRMIQGCLCDEYGYPIDPEWERLQREIEEHGWGRIPLLKPPKQEVPDAEAPGDGPRGGVD